VPRDGASKCTILYHVAILDGSRGALAHGISVRKNRRRAATLENIQILIRVEFDCNTLLLASGEVGTRERRRMQLLIGDLPKRSVASTARVRSPPVKSESNS
jgi:hypothetical protein